MGNQLGQQGMNFANQGLGQGGNGMFGRLQHQISNGLNQGQAMFDDVSNGGANGMQSALQLGNQMFNQGMHTAQQLANQANQQMQHNMALANQMMNNGLAMGNNLAHQWQSGLGNWMHTVQGFANQIPFVGQFFSSFG